MWISNILFHGVSFFITYGQNRFIIISAIQQAINKNHERYVPTILSASYHLSYVFTATHRPLASSLSVLSNSDHRHHLPKLPCLSPPTPVTSRSLLPKLLGSTSVRAGVTETRSSSSTIDVGAARYTTLDPICVETLVHAMDSLTRVVERSIAAEIPDHFGLIFDGWTHASEHFIAAFECYEVEGVRKTPLLCMALLLNALEEDLTARGHMEFLANIRPAISYALLVQDPELISFITQTLKLAACASLVGANHLKRGEKAVLGPFRSQDDDASQGTGAGGGGEVASENEDSLIEQLQKRRRLATKEAAYELLSCIQPTSNVTVRFFSMAHTTFGQERHSLQPITLEMILFLG
ncbi:unnamed protein product [Phytophthora fragariaefolia]|uniref:Unnamed protein product n=1 Tax=Phytophthora fragariaefolia TaxID=1490495 RepID=A0A9W7CYS5_9STRA|nr:unnamed protein product [Phytophthora fragariaefolia]